MSKTYTEDEVLKILEKNRVEYMQYCFNMTSNIADLSSRVEKLEKEKVKVIVLVEEALVNE